MATKPARELDVDDFIIVRVPVTSVYRDLDKVLLNGDPKMTFAPDEEVEYGTNPAQQVEAVPDKPLVTNVAVDENGNVIG